MDDGWSYALFVRGVGWVTFCGCVDLHNGWVRLHGDGGPGGDGLEIAGAPGHFPRGLEVRLSDVVCCGDAPWGS